MRPRRPDLWKRGGEHHFRIEEEVLLPLWTLLGTVGDQVAARLSREHLGIRFAAIALESQRPSLELLRSLDDQLAAHVRFEERELFPLIEEDLGARELDRLATVVSEAEQRR